MRKISRAQPKAFSEGSGYISQYILTRVGIRTVSTSKMLLYCPSWEINIGDDSSYWTGSWGYIFPYFPEDKAIQVCIGPVKTSAVEALEKIHIVWRAILKGLNFNILIFSN